MSACVEIRQLRFRWPGQAQDCLVLPELRITKGERIFLHGPSGSGKSTLLGLLGGVLLPSAGTISVLGRDLASLSASQRDGFRVDHIGIIFQQFNLIPYLTVLDNVLLPCRFSPRRNDPARRTTALAQDEACRLLGHLEIPSALYARRASELSVGQQQRVAAARALIGRPEIVIADEPTSALDAARQQAFLDLLSAECQASASTLIFVSHDERLAAHCDRLIALPEINNLDSEACAS